LAERLTAEFDAHRSRLRAIAFRLLGSADEAEDAVQETWLRLNRTDFGGVENLGGWLTTVVSRVCLDMLRARKSRREELAGPELSDVVAIDAREGDPEQEALLADRVGAALIVVLDTLGPAERLAFVLHDLFAVPFDDIGLVLGRSSDAAKQLASRARRRLEATTPTPLADPVRQHEVVRAFLAASRRGDFEALVGLLDPDVILTADAAAVEIGAAPEVEGARAVAAMFSGRALAAQPALIDGSVGIAWAPGGRPRVAWSPTVVNDRIVCMTMTADPRTIEEFELTLLPSDPEGGKETTCSR
jgi:RNA polymerase sigma-70 factor (ECF subfamily)